VRETAILVEQQPLQGIFDWDHAGLVINEFSSWSLRADLAMVSGEGIGCPLRATSRQGFNPRSGVRSMEGCYTHRTGGIAGGKWKHRQRGELARDADLEKTIVRTVPECPSVATPPTEPLRVPGATQSVRFSPVQASCQGRRGR